MPDTFIWLVRLPSVSSVAVAPGSVKVSPTLICIAAPPLSVTTGGVVSVAAGVEVPVVGGVEVLVGGLVVDGCVAVGVGVGIVGGVTIDGGGGVVIVGEVVALLLKVTLGPASVDVAVLVATCPSVWTRK